MKQRLNILEEVKYWSSSKEILRDKTSVTVKRDGYRELNLNKDNNQPDILGIDSKGNNKSKVNNLFLETQNIRGLRDKEY